MPAQKDRGVSPLIATTLIIGITVVLAATGAAYFIGFADQTQTQNTGEYSFGTDYSEDTITIKVVAASTGEETGFEVKANGEKIHEIDSLTTGDTIRITNLDEEDTVEIIATHEDSSQPVGEFDISTSVGTPSDAPIVVGQVTNPVTDLSFYQEDPVTCGYDEDPYSSDDTGTGYVEVASEQQVDSMRVTVTSDSYQNTLTLDDFTWNSDQNVYEASLTFENSGDYEATLETVTVSEKTFNDGRTASTYIDSNQNDACEEEHDPWDPWSWFFLY